MLVHCQDVEDGEICLYLVCRCVWSLGSQLAGLLWGGKDSGRDNLIPTSCMQLFPFYTILQKEHEAPQNKSITRVGRDGAQGALESVISLHP